MIDELSEGEGNNYEASTREVKPKLTETVMRHEIKEVPSVHIKENDTKIGLDVTEMERKPNQVRKKSKQQPSCRNVLVEPADYSFKSDVM